MQQAIVISGTGMYAPPNIITNEEIVASYNAYVAGYNEQYKDEIAAGSREALRESSVAFIKKASGIIHRHVVDAKGILDVERMCPDIPERPDDEPSVQCEMSVAAARGAMAQAGKTAADIDLVIVSCAGIQRAYPALAVEVQNQLGITGGYAYDMNVACSAATFAIRNAVDALTVGSARCVLMVNPEIMTGHANFRERDSHFIFGDVATAVILERADTCTAADVYEILGTKAITKFSNNVRCNFGFLNRCESDGGSGDRLFKQNGLKVFKEVIPIASKLIIGHLADLGIELGQLRRMWLHQANSNMNRVIGEKVLGRTPTFDDAPSVIDEYANIASAGSILAFHLHRDDLVEGDIGVICSFGAGYSAGSVIIRKGMPAM